MLARILASLFLGMLACMAAADGNGFMAAILGMIAVAGLLGLDEGM
jgi:hypothetical protein